MQTEKFQKHWGFSELVGCVGRKESLFAWVFVLC